MTRILLFVVSTLGFAAGFTTSLGDANPYVISAIATDPMGNTYVVGSRQLGAATTISVLNGAIPPVLINTPNGSDVFVSKLDSNGKLLFTDTFGGKGIDTGTSIALDPSGNIYIAGFTTSSDFPLSNALQTQPGTAFIMKLSGDGSTILYSTYFGGTLGTTGITSLATDANGNLYLTGMTTATDFPHTAGMPAGQIQDTQEMTVTGAFVTSISAAGDKILYSGVISGTMPAIATDTCTLSVNGNLCFLSTGGVGIAVDAAGNAYITGNTEASNLAVTAGALSSTGFGAFVAKVNAGGAGLSYLTYLTPSQTLPTLANAIAVDAGGNAYIGGYTSDPKFPATPGVLGAALGPATNGFVAKLNPTGSALVWATYLGSGNGGGSAAVVQSLKVSPTGNVWAVGLAASSTIPNTNGWTTGTAFLVGLNAAASQFTYSALFPRGTVEQSVALDPSGLVHVAGPSGFVSAIAPTTAPAMKIFGFQNAFGGDLTARISPAEVVAIYGPGIGPTTPVTAAPTNGFYPTTLGSVQVTVNGANIPLLYVSQNQINAVLPMELTANTAATVRVINGSSVSPDYPVWIVPFAPQAFPTVLNQDGTVNSQTNPADGGSVVTFYATGWQSSFAPLADGEVATVAQDACQGTCRLSTEGTLLYGGAAPGIVAGVTQINVQLGLYPPSINPFLFQISVTGPSLVTESLWIK
ncbi:MAG TPA: SBBP repeat-containing protein [Bryobacteraceae bacterium]|jgi:uncharacterized protein (TIGR03437 family)|nr:SBBP repeat-containing protein [Bryobacteraceae bacterium]